MKNYILIFTISFIYSGLTANAQDGINLIPKPALAVLAAGNFNLGDIRQIAYNDNSVGTIRIAEWLRRAQIFRRGSLPIGYSAKPPAQKSVYLQKIKGEGHPEFYRLKVAKSAILLEAFSERGLFYAVQSLIQVAQTSPRRDSAGHTLIPYCVVEDQPAFDYRGLHLDVGRHFFPVSFIKQYIDLMARFKFNYFHWHLTDDQGWRIEIKKYPALVQVGSHRKETLIGHAGEPNQKFDGKPYGGYYTQEEIAEVVKYASERFIEIIPEIEMPGHCMAALASYPVFGCTGGPYEVATRWGIFEEVLCTKDTSLQFVKDILDEVCALFPGHYIHIGGDEVLKTRWKNCDHCRAVMRRNSLRNEEELQSYFIRQIGLHLNRKNKQLIGWDEILEGGLAHQAIVMSWRGSEGAISAAKQNHKAIMCPVSHCYFDHYASASASEPLAIGGYTTLEKTYSFDPVPAELPSELHSYIWGAQGNVWTEYIKEPSHVLYMAYPRAVALAEVVWTKKADRDYGDFLNRLRYHLPWFRSKHMNIARHMLELDYKILASPDNTYFVLKRPAVDGKILVESFQDGDYFQEYLTHDTFLLDRDVDCKIWYQLPDNSLGNPIHLQYKRHKACGAKVRFEYAPSEKYSSGGESSIVNGLAAPTHRYGGDEWLGFEGKDAIISLELAGVKTCDSLSLQYYQSPASWIYPPRQIEVYSSNDGKDYRLYKSMKLDKHIQRAGLIALSLEGLSTAYLKIHVHNHGMIDADQPGKGHAAWLFIGELVLK